MPTIASSSPVSGTAALAATGSTALVVEYMCLFTRDLRRKQKRWQDGRLKYHTFNKRIMVYDDRGNFIGDAHWQADEALDVGEELQLERGSAIVQVSDCVGQQTQDLSELVDKRVQEKEQRHAIAAARTPALPRARRPEPALQPQPDHFQLRHRPLNTLIGTPTGHHGRAMVAAGSPFEQRQKTTPSTDQHDEERPGKRRKRDNTPPSKMGYARSLFGTTLSLSGAPTSSGPSQWPPAESQRRLPQMPAPRPDNASAGLDKTDSLEPPKAATSRHWSSSIEITGVVHHSPEPLRAPHFREDRLGRQGSSVQPGEHITSGQGAVSSTTNHHPLKEISNLTASDRRTAPAKAAKSTKPSVNALELSKSPSPEKRAKPASRVQKKPRRTQPSSSPPVIEQASVEIIEIEDEVQAVEVVERAKPGGDGPRTELRLKSRRKRGLLLVTEQETPVSKRGRTAQTLIQRRQPLSTESSRMASDIEDEEFKDRHRPSESPDAIDIDGPFSADAPGQTSRRQKKGAPDTLLSSEASGNESLQKKKTREQRKTRKTKIADREGDPSSNGEETSRRRIISRAVSYSTNSGRAVESLEVFDSSDEDADAIRLQKEPKKDRSLPPAAPAPAGPRLVRLARKSVKSKELIGFVMKDDTVPNRHPRLALIQAQSRFQESPKNIPNQSGILAEDLSIEMDRSGLVEDESRDESFSIDAPMVPDLGCPPLACDQITLAAEKPRLEPGIDSVLGNNQARAVDAQPGSNKSCDPHDCQPPQAQSPTLEVAQSTAPAPVFGALDEGIAELGSTRGVGNLTKDRPHPSVPLKPALGQIQAPVTPQSDPTDSSDQLAVLSAAQNQQARLVNPATRGRKAALRTHAAGQTPQSFLPPDTGPAVPGARLGGDNGIAASKAGSNEPPKIKMKFPGFISANAGGPWSREAHDLFATGRPG